MDGFRRESFSQGMELLCTYGWHHDYSMFNTEGRKETFFSLEKEDIGHLLCEGVENIAHQLCQFAGSAAWSYLPLGDEWFPSHNDGGAHWSRTQLKERFYQSDGKCTNWPLFLSFSMAHLLYDHLTQCPCHGHAENTCTVQ